MTKEELLMEYHAKLYEANEAYKLAVKKAGEIRSKAHKKAFDEHNRQVEELSK